ncbi:MAG: peptide chain release factor 1 [Planctomycetota bacterium]|nr:MAG: peptide chain release factor 1 [Planctomycetota bacterium]
MRESVEKKLEEIEARCAALEKEMSDPEVISNQARYRIAVKEHGSLAKMVGMFRSFKSLQTGIREAEEIIENETDKEFVELARDELSEKTAAAQKLEEELLGLLVTRSEDSARNAIVEIRAGTGGDEAALFAGDIFRMYSRYAEKKGWKIEILDSNPTDLGGFKEVVFNVSGDDVFDIMKHESGGHRVQRVPRTEAQGRIHTSAITVAVMPEAEEVDVKIAESDLKIDRIRGGGPGGQSVNKTSSTIRVTHIPSGIVVRNQDEKSQHKNLAKAMKILRSKLLEKERSEKKAERDAERKSKIGSGDRSQKIRTYNFPENRVTDHRINLKLYTLDKVLQGELDEIVEKLAQHEREEKLKEL